MLKDVCQCRHLESSHSHRLRWPLLLTQWRWQGWAHKLTLAVLSAWPSGIILTRLLHHHVVSEYQLFPPEPCSYQRISEVILFRKSRASVLSTVKTFARQIDPECLLCTWRWTEPLGHREQSRHAPCPQALGSESSQEWFPQLYTCVKAPSWPALTWNIRVLSLWPLHSHSLRVYYALSTHSPTKHLLHIFLGGLPSWDPHSQFFPLWFCWRGQGPDGSFLSWVFSVCVSMVGPLMLSVTSLLFCFSSLIRS